MNVAKRHFKVSILHSIITFNKRKSISLIFHEDISIPRTQSERNFYLQMVLYRNLEAIKYI